MAVGYDDPLERLHRANRARILKGAKEGKYWLLRSESMDEGVRDELIRKIIETTTTGAIGGRSMPMGVSKSDPAMGGRNRFRDEQTRKNMKWFASLKRRVG